MNKIWSDDAWDDYIYWQGQDMKTLRKSMSSLRTLTETDTSAKGSPSLSKAIYPDSEAFILMKK